MMNSILTPNSTNRNDINFQKQSLVEIMKSYKLTNSMNKIPRFFNAKLIELLDKFASSFVYFALAVSMSMEGLFDETLSYHNLYISLKDSENFKSWHREAEDYFDSSNKRMQELLEKLGAVVFNESGEAEDVRRFMQHITSDIFYNSLNSQFMDKSTGTLAKYLDEINKVLQKAHGWHKKSKIQRSQSVAGSEKGGGDLGASLIDRKLSLKRKRTKSSGKMRDRITRDFNPNSAKMPRVNSKYNKNLSFMDKNKPYMRYTYDDDLSEQRKKIMFKLKNKNYDKLREKKGKGFLLKSRGSSPKKGRVSDDLVRLRGMCKNAKVMRNLISAKSNFFL